MTLEILICTIKDGINRATNVILPPTHNVKYLISWQSPNGEIPEGLKRDDIKVITMQEKGLSRNRNNAIDNASGDICLIADDDLKYNPMHLSKIIEIFEAHPTVQLATFKYTSGAEQKWYPSYSFDLRQMPRNYYVSSIEIAFRLSAVKGKIAFNELFGIGAPVLGAGEEEMFILDALKKDIHCMYFPLEIVRHNGASTTNKNTANPSVLMARGAYSWRRFPHTCRLRAFIIAWRLHKYNNVEFLHAFHYTLKGISYAKHYVKS
ncbi:MAG: glycosyltransferase [Muribaculaceae bacterium]